jgi:expansin
VSPRVGSVPHVRRLVVGAATVLIALLAVVGCSSGTGAGSSPAVISAAAAPPAVVPTRFPVLDALVTEPPATSPPATTTSPTSSPSATPTPSVAPATQPPVPATTSAPRPPVSVVAPAAGRIRPGVVYSGRATEHDAGSGDGNCLFGPLGDSAMQVVAMNEVDYDNARSCGAFLEVTGPGGTTVVKVVDRCPECPVGALDLSQQAFARIAGGAHGGLDKVSWRLVSPADIGPVQFMVKKESSQWWLSVQVRNHRNPVASLEIRLNGSWVPVQRQMYNFYEQEGFGAGPYTIRVTDIYGEQLVSTVNLSPSQVQTTNSQFARH